jgi:hypothetical protein
MNLQHFDTILAFALILAGVSLLITTLTQMVSALLALRGKNLLWGIKTLLTELDPNLKEHAATIAEKVLQQPLISDSMMSGANSEPFKRWKLASAIRKEELIAILGLLAQEAPAVGAPPSKPEPWVAALRESLDDVDSQAAKRLLDIAPEIRKALPHDPAAVERILSQLTRSAEHLSGSLNQWFDSMMDRVSQRFVMHTRIWTVIFSVLLAFVMHLDAFKLLTQLSSDAELRTRLIASTEALTKKAEELQITSTNQLPVTEAAVSQLTNALSDFQDILHDKLKLQLVPDPYPEWSSYWTSGMRHFWGTLASAALLSLGAPFWFNVLKSMSSLRPILAKQEEKKGK